MFGLTALEGDDEVGMFGADGGAADLHAFESGLVDELSGGGVWGVFEDAAGVWGIKGLAISFEHPDFAGSFEDSLGVIVFELEGGIEDEGSGDIGGSVIEDEVIASSIEDGSGGVHDGDFGDEGADVAEFTAGVHSDGAGDGPWDSGEGFEPCASSADGFDDEFLDIGAWADVEEVVVEMGVFPGVVAEAEDGAVDAVVADDEVSAEADDVDGDVVIGATACGFL